jgi:hypothetical protein
MTIGRTLETAMRQLLLDLALTSNGRSGSYAGSSTGGDHADVVPTLGLFDAPHLYFAREWDQAVDDAERAVVVQRARDTLDEIRRSPSPEPLVVENAEERARRIVKYGVGLEPYQVAISAKCTPTFVRHARVAAGRDPEKGRLLKRWRDMTPPEREVMLAELQADGLSGRAIAEALGTSYSTIARALGWKQ